MTARVYLLGRVVIEGVDSFVEERDFAGRTSVLAFAYLMLERDRSPSNEELAHVLWPAGRPSDWEGQIEGLVGGLRGLLDRSGVKGRDIIASSPGGYTVQLNDVWLDAKAAADRIREADAALARGELDRAKRDVTVAKGIVGRTFLHGEKGPWIELQRERLRELERTSDDILEGVERGATQSEPIRVVKTFMFTDIVDSTRLVELLGDVHWTDLLRWHDVALRECFAAHDGEEVDHAGDGFLVAFPDQRSGIASVVMIQRRLAEQRKSHGFAPQVRIGLHSAESSSTADGYKGLGVHEAACIGGLAGGGQIKVSLETVEGLTDIAVKDAETAELKGFSEPVEVVSVDWERSD